MELKTITVGDLVYGIGFEEVHLSHADEEIQLVTIVDFNKDTLTEAGEKEWKDVLDAKVTGMSADGYGIILECSDIPAKRIEEFSYMIVGNCPNSLYNKYVKQD